MRRILIYIYVALAAVSCISNDLPYPVTQAYITGMEIEQAERVDINFDTRTITAYFPETVDVRAINITSVTYDKDNVTSSVSLVGEHDLTSPFKFNIRIYHDYQWQIVAVRQINRSFEVSGQIGSSAIDEVNHRVILSVGKRTNLSRLDITALKLGPAGLSTYAVIDMHSEEVIATGGDEILSQLGYLDLSGGLYVDVTAFDQTERWSIFIEVSDVNLLIKNVNPWTRHAYVTAMGVAGQECTFRYRKVSDQDWTDVPAQDIETDGGTFTALIRELMPATEYEVIAVCGDEQTNAASFVTEPVVALPNASFEYASLVTGKNYYKFYDPACGVNDGKYMFWGSGNGEGPDGVNGSANMGIVITTVDTEDKVDGKQSVCAQTSQMTGILAAGNLFAGQFVGLVGTEGGIVNFGRPWTSRPVALKLYCKYVTGQIDIIKSMPPGVTLTKQDYDRAQIKIALGTWDYKKYGGSPESPVQVNTTDSKTFVDYYTDPSTIAHAELIVHNDGYIVNGTGKTDELTSVWVEYTLPLEYSDLNTLPTHIVISCAASQYGDYFTGCSTSKLWLDKFELVY